jgi:hypothetical protein
LAPGKGRLVVSLSNKESPIDFPATPKLVIYRAVAMLPA